MSPEKRDFDAAAQTWDQNPARVAMARAVAEAIMRQVPLDAQMDMMDYGAGTGLLTLSLAPHVRSVTAVDSSRGMLDVLNEKIRKQGMSSVRTEHLDLESDPPPHWRFDLITSSMTLHHIEDPGKLVAKLAALLKPGGRLCVADLDREDGSFHGDNTGVLHFGFDRSQIMDLFEQAGLKEPTQVTAHRITREVEGKGLREFSVFLICGRR